MSFTESGIIQISHLKPNPEQIFTIFNEKAALAGIEHLVRKPTVCYLTRSGTRIDYLMNAMREFSKKAYLDT